MTTLLRREERRGPSTHPYRLLREIPRHPQRDRWRFSSVAHGEECKTTGKDFTLPFSAVLQRALKRYPNIAMDPEVLAGTPRIQGTRIPVYMVIEAVRYWGLDGALASYPDLTAEQVQDALAFAIAVLEHRDD